MKKMSIILSFIILIAVVTGACSNGGESDDAVTLKVWNRYPELNPTFEQFAKDFEKENPEIKIDLQNIPVGSAAAQYQTAISEKSLPDIFTTSTVTLRELVDMDMAKDLSELFTEDIKDDYYPGTWYENGTTINNIPYVFPLFSPNHGVNMMFYNKDVLEENNISENELPQTWDELMEMGKEIHKNSDGQTYGLMWYNDDWANAGVINYQSTAIFPETPENINYKKGTPDFNNIGKIETIEYLKTLQKENVMHPTSLEIDTSQAEANFAAGKAAFYIGGNWTGTNLIETSNFDNWGVVEMPTKDGKPWYHSANGTNGLIVNNDTEHAEEVKVFLNYALDHIYSDVILKAGSTQPAKMDVEGEAPFPQYEEITELMTDQAITVPDPTERSLKTIDFKSEYTSQLSFSDVGEIAVGYLAGEVKDLKSELDKMNAEANKTFDKLLEDTPEVTRELYQFPNWEPFTPYTKEDYETLK
ncbi:sugar ABC transporter substrate-binding protein [Lederbergia sp. NSJ-179]|uniref:ABC transporter substrate-binding protein n=1 Tax=Lederbergia sp. NSJ-179 TaxID=2931402 RepID=UPI001FD4008D|nr:sugar ABC transporter substrate-binding protein [Lederbergia sp. NSJ-179]MCJ7842113.1 sugar ABC transporter substrate-binding protein [Lederbergia sp. NSJ-179]